MNDSLKEKIEELALPLIKAQGLELWGLEIIPGPTMQVCLYVDVPDAGEHSASIDQCEAISRQLGLALDVEDDIDQAWRLEVSSPGLERRFFNLAQMRPYVGDVVEVKLAQPLPGTSRKAWRGVLEKVGEDAFEIRPCSLKDDGEIIYEGDEYRQIPWDMVSRVRRQHVFTLPQKPGKAAQPRKKQVKK